MSSNDMNIEWVDPNSLKPNSRNPNVHSPEQIERLSKIIQYQNWRWPIIVSKQSGLIVAGHGRLEAAKKLGQTTVPVSYQDFLDEDQEYAFLVGDNAISQWSEMDLSLINSSLSNLGPDFLLDHLGLKDFRIDAPPMTDKEPAEHCPTCNRKMKKKDATHDT